MSCLLTQVYESRGLLGRQGPSLVTRLFAGDAMPGVSGCVTYHGRSGDHPTWRLPSLRSRVGLASRLQNSDMREGGSETVTLWARLSVAFTYDEVLRDSEEYKFL